MNQQPNVPAKNFIFSVLLLLGPFFVLAQPQASARFLFNDGDSTDLVSKRKAELHHVQFAPDRFGNEGYAVYLYGNEQSFVSLGSFDALKPQHGSVSLWVKIEHPMMVGTGVRYNPILLARNANEVDFNEAYSFYYMLDTKKMIAVCAKDSTREIGLYARDTVRVNDWKHLVLTYNDTIARFYLDGVEQLDFVKTFKTVFSQNEPVLVGITQSSKNNRWSNITVDDIEVFSYVLTAAEVKELFEAPNPNRWATIRQWIWIGIGVVLLLVLITLAIRYQLKKSFERQRKLLEQNNAVISTELRVNRALMNPHFVFNALNALQNLILNNQNDKANDYLVKFSKMIRKLLESNMSDVITVALEVELLRQYMEIENLRFDESIQFQIDIDNSIEANRVHIPVMMIQPFVENAIWHGLLRKKGEKTIHISFLLEQDHYILCTIEDNGIGKKKTKSSAIFDKTSLATSFIEQRLLLFNQIMQMNCYLKLDYKPDQQGCIFKILLPILKQ